MKYILSFFTIFILIVATASPAFAVVPTTESNATPLASPTLLDVIQSIPLEEIHGRLTDPSAFEEEIHFATVQATPILPVYKNFRWTDFDRSFDELSAFFASSVDTNEKAYYRNMHLISLGENPFCLAVRATDGSLCLRSDYPNGLPQYLKDIKESPASMVFFGQACTVSKLLCLTSDRYELVFFRTDKGDFVRVYSYYTPGGTDFRFEEFQTYAKAYYKAISSYYYNYDIHGSGKGGHYDFLDFAASYDPPKAWELVLYTLGAGTLIGTVTVSIVIHKKHRKQHAKDLRFIVRLLRMRKEIKHHQPNGEK